ncbi:MAG: glycosyltransferase [Isosphaeraceae bacterium]|nr:glycosyltransferase [Isosphaeraceae bacterium]
MATPRRMEAGAGRPFAFLVSTTGCARAIPSNLGSSAYSYYFVVEALAPVLERLGTWRLVDRPESRLAYLAARAEAEGYRPVHLAINPPQDVYLCPAVPTVLFPFWEFPDLPNRNFGRDPRQNWVRISRRADLILTACRFTADAFRRAGVAVPTAVVPVPLDPIWFDLPAWDLRHSWTTLCRHLVWGGEAVLPLTSPAPYILAQEVTGRASWKQRAWWLARGVFRTIYPWLTPAMVARISRIKQEVLALAGQSPAKLAYLAVRGAYRRLIRRWLSPEALERIAATKNRLLEMAGRSPTAVLDPRLPAAPLTLGGLVYTSILNLSDRRKNYKDMLSAFLLAFRDRPDATLVLKLATSPHREAQELKILKGEYEGLGLSHRCRLVVITDYLDDDQMRGLLRATTFYVNTSHAEGACLPLQQALAAGRPGIAPDHTAMADYLDETVGFILRSHPEPAPWPHDPEQRLETTRYRLVWSDLFDHFLASAAVADSDPARYAALAEAARRRMLARASREVAVEALERALDLLPEGGAQAQRRIA